MKLLARIAAEAILIIFLFYSNLLMGEFERAGNGHARGLAWALGEVVTVENFSIALVSALAGATFAEFIPKYLAKQRRERPSTGAS